MFCYKNLIKDQSFKQKKLTYWFLISLICNLFLNLDCVENFFYTKNETVSIKLHEVCSSQAKFKLPSSPQKTIILASLDLNINSHDLISKAQLGNRILPLNLLVIKKLINPNNIKFNITSYEGRFSGLSPPLV
jgi:hypothetical protein